MKHTPRSLAGTNKLPTPTGALPSAASAWTSSCTVSPRIGLTALTLAALLLTGCSQEKTSSAPSPSATASSSSPSDQATSTPTPAPSPSESTSYSGGSKDPAGEYRPADDLGPAQNVPRPVEPEGMNIESEEGLQKFLFYWNDTMNYGIQTGDFTAARPLVDESFTLDVEFMDFAAGLYDDGGWISGGLRQVVLGEGLMVNQGDGYYTWAGNLNIDNIKLHLDGVEESFDHSSTLGTPMFYTVRFDNHQWKIYDSEEIEAN
ncbi:MAG: DUF6318 family protein [Rothia sp. (in: high G+C Gram-positive bacteria)]|nr:DUF6318 family protein [Rothia sp. (in: high G+C Gram-positive bacteria)]